MTDIVIATVASVLLAYETCLLMFFEFSNGHLLEKGESLVLPVEPPDYVIMSLLIQQKAFSFPRKKL